MESDNYPLHKAVKRRDIPLILRILTSGIDVNQKDENGRTPLHYAVLPDPQHTREYTENQDSLEASPLPFRPRSRSSMDSIREHHVHFLRGKAVAPAPTRSGRLSDDPLVLDPEEQYEKNVVSIRPRPAARPDPSDCVYSLLRNGANVDVNIQDNDGRTALHLALQSDYHDSIYVLLQGSTDVEVNIHDSQGCTPLHLAAQSNSFRSIDLFLSSSADVDVNIQDKDGRTALHLATLADSYDVINTLISSGQIDVNIQDNDGRTALNLAAQADANNAISTLLDSENIDFNIQDNDGRTTLHLAAQAGLYLLMSTLLNNKHIDVNIQDKDGRTPLHLATQANFPGVISLFLHRRDDIDVNIQDKDGRTALHLAAQADWFLVTNKLLNSRHVGVNTQDNDDLTTIHLAAQAASSHVTRALLSSEHIDVNIRDNNGRTALHVAAQADFSHTINSLIHSKKDVGANIQDRDGRTALHLAVQVDSYRLIETLLSIENIDVNIQDKDGCTALHLAIQANSSKCALLLLGGNANVDINIRDKRGHTSFQHVALSNWEDLAPLFLKHGADPLIINRLWRFRQDSSTEKRPPEYLKVWENAINGFDYGTVDALLKNILTAGRHAAFGSIIWEWEVPAVLDISYPSGAIDSTSPNQHVVLTNNKVSMDYMGKPEKGLQATTCTEYLAQCWETEQYDFVSRLLDLVKLAHLGPENSGFSTCAVPASEPRKVPLVSVTCYQSSILINFANNEINKVVDLIKALDWLCKAMRMPRIEDSLSLSTSTCRLERLAMTDTIEDDPYRGPVSQKYFLRSRVNLKISPLPRSDHNCWHQLFRSCIVADSMFPRYRDFGKGLEASFDLMVSLAAVEFALIIGGGVVFTGYQTVLIPTAIQGRCAQFHLITTSKSQINPYTLDLGDRVLTKDPSLFKGMRCFLGWCEAAQINLGTKQLPATVTHSSGPNHGKSLQLDGYSILAQFGTSSPLSALLGLQSNFRYASHRCQFTPLGNYCKLLQDTSRELAIVYDAGQRRSWLVPKLSLLLHMSHAYTLACDGIPIDRVPYVEPHTDAVEVIKVLEPSGNTVIHGEGTDKFLFRELMLGLNTNLLKTIALIHKSSNKTLYGFEFMDVVTEPGRGTCMKKLEVLSSGKNWLKIVNAVDAVVVCSGIGETITAVVGNGKKSTECSMLPKDLDYLAATLPCLDRLAQRKGGRLNAGSRHIKIADNASWELRGDPFGACEHSNASGTCWERSELVQRLDSDPLFGFQGSVRTKNQSPLKQIPVSGAVVFGKKNP